MLLSQATGIRVQPATTMLRTTDWEIRGKKAILYHPPQGPLEYFPIDLFFASLRNKISHDITSPIIVKIRENIETTS